MLIYNKTWDLYQMHADWFTGNISEIGVKDFMHVTFSMHWCSNSKKSMANALSQEPFLENDNLPVGIKLFDDD